MAWSCAADTKWVWTRPFVDSPHTKKLPKSNQKAPLRHASPSAPNAACTGRTSLPDGAASSSPVAPYGSNPMSDGRSRRNSTTMGTTASAPMAIVTPTHRQPTPSARRDSSGRKTSCPLAVAAVSAPVTRPRRATNQRLATVEANTVAMQPEPTPTTTPQSRNSCHGSVICVVPRAPSEMIVRAMTVTRRRP